MVIVVALLIAFYIMQPSSALWFWKSSSTDNASEPLETEGELDEVEKTSLWQRMLAPFRQFRTRRRVRQERKKNVGDMDQP